MNGLELKAECIRCGMGLGELANAIDMNESTLYRKMTGKTEFQRIEMAKIRKVLGLSKEKFIEIFFAY